MSDVVKLSDVVCFNQHAAVKRDRFNVELVLVDYSLKHRVSFGVFVVLVQLFCLNHLDFEGVLLLEKLKNGISRCQGLD